MPGGDDLIRIIDAALEKSEITSVISALQPLKEEIKAFSSISIFTKNTQGAQEFRAQAQQLQEALNRLKTVEQELEQLRSKGSTASKVRTDQEIADTQRKSEATRSRVKDIRAEEDAYKNLTNQYNKAQTAAKSLAAAYGVHSKEAQAATKTAKELGEQISAINKATGNNAPGTGVGRYAEGIKDFAKEALAATAAFFGLQKGIEFIKDSIKEFMDQEAALSRLKNILNNIGRDDVFANLNKEAKELAEHFGTIKDEDITEAFQKLVVYGKLTENQIKTLMPVIIDFAAKQRIDLPEATGVITKALEGNARALKEYGINVKDGKDTTERLAIIMDQLKPKVDGAAEAFGTTLAGGMKKAEIASDELKKKIGEEFAPVLSKIWQSILEGIKGIPEMISSFGDAFSNVADNAKYAYFWVKGLFGSVGDLANYEIAKKQREKILEDSKQLQRAREEAESFRKEAAKRTLSDQAHELNVQKQLLIGDLARYKLEASRGKVSQETSFELQKQNEIVKALTAQYKSSRDTRILGNGDPNDKGSAGDEAIKREIEAQAKLYALRLQAAIDYQKILAEEKNNTIASRTEAYKKLIDLEREQVEGERDLKLKNTKLTEGERELIIYEAEEKMTKYQVENIGRLAQIRFDALNNDKILAAENAKELEDIAAAHFKAIAELEAKALATRLAYLNEAKNIELSAIDRDYLGGKITKEQYEKKRTDVNYNADKARLTTQRDAAKQKLSTNPNDAALADSAQGAQTALDDLEAQHKMTADDKVAANKRHLADLEIQAAKEVGHAIESFVTGAYERQINAIQKQIDLNNEAKEKGNKSIQDSTLSLQEKAAAEILLNNKIQDSNEALHRRQRDLKVKEAQFDRAASILEITEQAAIAAIAALKIPIYGEAEAIAIGVIAAAQIASILAKPIPTYWTGVESKPVDGPMIVGERGSERITEPSGKTYMTPGVPTLMYGKKGTRITPAHEINQEMLSGIMRAQVHEMRQDRTEELLTTLIQIGQNQTSAMRKKQVIHNHIHWNPGFNDHINSAVRN